jgi:predicted nucleic acid-binding protein
VIALDTNIYIYALDEQSEFCRSARSIIALLEQGAEEGMGSVLVLSEIMRKPSLDLLKTLYNLVNHSFMPVTEDIALLASKLYLKYPKIKSYDELHVASAIIHGAETFYTNDKDILEAGITEIEIKGL